MLFLASTTYDANTRVLTAQFRSPTETSWATYEYRDVPTELYDHLCAAKPHTGDLLEELIAPFHEVRRVGQSAWHAPTRPTWDLEDDGF